MKMTEEKRKEYFDRHMTPYNNGRELNETDMKILEILVNAQLDIAIIHYEMTDMPQIERTQTLHQDMMLLLHIWKKADGAI